MYSSMSESLAVLCGFDAGSATCPLRLWATTRTAAIFCDGGKNQQTVLVRITLRGKGRLTNAGTLHISLRRRIPTSNASAFLHHLLLPYFGGPTGFVSSLWHVRVFMTDACTCSVLLTRGFHFGFPEKAHAKHPAMHPDHELKQKDCTSSEQKFCQFDSGGQHFRASIMDTRLCIPANTHSQNLPLLWFIQCLWFFLSDEAIFSPCYRNKEQWTRGGRPESPKPCGRSRPSRIRWAYLPCNFDPIFLWHCNFILGCSSMSRHVIRYRLVTNWGKVSCRPDSLFMTENQRDIYKRTRQESWKVKSIWWNMQIIDIPYQRTKTLNCGEKPVRISPQQNMNKDCSCMSCCRHHRMFRWCASAKLHKWQIRWTSWVIRTEKHGRSILSPASWYSVL